MKDSYVEPGKWTGPKKPFRFEQGRNLLFIVAVCAEKYADEHSGGHDHHGGCGCQPEGGRGASVRSGGGRSPRTRTGRLKCGSRCWAKPWIVFGRRTNSSAQYQEDGARPWWLTAPFSFGPAASLTAPPLYGKEPCRKRQGKEDIEEEEGTRDRLGRVTNRAINRQAKSITTIRVPPPHKGNQHHLNTTEILLLSISAINRQAFR